MGLLKRDLPAAVLTAMAGFLAIVWITRRGMAVSFDSIIYLGVAKNILSGRGFNIISDDYLTVALNHFPPFFPVLLAAGAKLFGKDPEGAARGLNVTLFVLNVSLFYFSMRRLNPRLFWTAVAGSFFMLTSAAMLQIHATVWSEPAFLFFSFLSLYLLGEYLERRGMLFLVASSVAAGIAALTRYAGVALIAAGIGALLFCRHQKAAGKGRDCLIFLALSAPALLFWLLRNVQAAGAITNRALSFHPVTLGHLVSFTDFFSAALFPARMPGGLRIAGLAALLGALLFFSIRIKKEPGRADSLRAYLYFIACYSAFLAGAITFFDAGIPMDSRLLSPILAAGLLWAFTIIGRIEGKARGGPAAGKRLWLAVAVLASIGLVKAVHWAHGASHSMTPAQIRNEPGHREIAKKLMGLSPGAVCYSNAPDMVYFLSGKFCYLKDSRGVHDFWRVSRVKKNFGNGEKYFAAFSNIPWNESRQ